ncbi:MAG: LysR family transcriptional regulator, partial [Proteobacteria bacterium]|nr:LysR family transcriptional regulator [Pseudomonadota bacterium]
AIDAVVAGLGVTRLLSYQVAGALKARTLRTILTEFEPEPSPVSLVYGGQRLLPIKTRAFIDFAAHRIRQRLGSL